MNKTLSCILGAIIAVVVGVGFLKTVNAYEYPYPQNFRVDQRRFDEQQAANLVMRRLEPSTTGQWAIAVVQAGGGGDLGLFISTATYGIITSTGTTVISPGYAVKKYSILSVGGLTTVTTNKTDGTLNLDDGMGFEQAFDYPVPSDMALTITVSTGVVHYAITGVK